ncbi:hypothetical protein HPB47_024028 [Ixodes persulcatus]|uniref:Uncharacterized protein n=1 Tax=Ixodes persulcatus TaxID=34615 RepID=A0AC60Q5F2_IXOPE|nr:hypothetical protein HPB47_024028 [Ixodes persulcatus]
MVVLDGQCSPESETVGGAQTSGHVSPSVTEAYPGLLAALVPNRSAETCSRSKPTHVVVIDDVTITDAAVGKTMVISYVGQLTEALNSSPSLKFTLTKNNGGGKIPCLYHLGSWADAFWNPTHVVVVDDVTITDAAVGKTMVISYVGQLTQALNDSPLLKFTMTKNAGGGQVPCINDLGSW